MEGYTYLFVNLSSVALPLLFSFHPDLRFDRTWNSFWPACVLIAVIFLAWDMLFTRSGVWGFNDRYLTGYDVGVLPIEEVLFFICIPYACVFTYHCLNIFIKKQIPVPVERAVSIGLGFLLILFGILNLELQYTSTTFISCGIFLLLHSFFFKFSWMPRFYLSYIVILPLFFLTNGILTGNFTEEPVVWYNNQENLKIRMLTIPVEDVFYGLLLIGLNISVYEFLKKHQSKTNSVPAPLN